jgi:hypothetical protein
MKYIVTSYTPGIPVHEQFLSYLKSKSTREGSQIIMIPTKPVARSDNWFDSATNGYLTRDVLVSGTWVIAGNIQVNPTAAKPCAGLSSLYGGKSLIVASPRQTITQVPTLIGAAPPCQLISTGGCNDWSGHTPSSLAGIKSAHHFRLGFVVLDGTAIRQIHATKKGEFTDLNIDHKGRFSPASAIVWGDLHAACLDTDAVNFAVDATIASKAKVIIGHDTFDGQTCNHHAVRYTDRFSRFDSIEEEVTHHNELLQDLEQMTRAKFVMPFSNHSAFLDRWATETAPILLRKNDLELYQQVLAKGSLSILYGQHVPLGSRYAVEGVDLSQHGDKGGNGGRGSLAQFADMGLKNITGHSHNPATYNGAASVGCLCEIQQPYSIGGLSSWRHSVATVNKYGKIQHIILEFT